MASSARRPRRRSLPGAADAPGRPAAHGSWRLVSRFLIRSAGFPFGIIDFGADQVSHALDHRAKTRAEAVTLLERWPTYFAAAVRGLESHGADRAALKALYQSRRAVARHLAVPPAAAAHLDAGWVRAWQDCLAQLDAAERQVDEAARQAAERGRTQLRRLLADGRFVAALAASNPELAGRLRRSLAADPTGRRSSTRQDERVVYAYAQRFATKNETISFFGPIDYGTFGGGDTIQLRYARQPLQARFVRLSHWAVQLLADHLAEDPDVAGHLPLRLREGYALTEAAPGKPMLLVAATGRRAPLTPGQAEVLELVTSGTFTATELASRLADSAAALDLVARKVVTCRPLAPTALDDPATWLAGLLAELRRAGVAAAARWHGLLSKLARGALAMAERADAERAALLGELESTFSAATGQPARRGAGEHYADRLLVTEDCRGAVADCAVPPRQAQALARRLSPTLLLCASYSVLIQQAVLVRALDLCATLARQGPVSYLRLIAELDRAMSVEDVMTDPALASWLEHFDQTVRSAVTEDAALVDPAALGPLLRELPAGLVVSPDIFLCADPSDVDIEHAPVVIGEIHHGAQVWSQLSVLDPDLAATGQEVAAVTGAGGELAALVCRRTQGKAFERELPGPVVRFRATAAQPHPKILSAETLTVRRAAGTLELAAPDGAPVRLHARHPRSPSNWLFGPPPVVAPTPLRTAAHAPRVLIGDVVAWRESWRLDAEQLSELAGARHAAELVRAAAALRERFGLPRLVFARAQLARKPVFADLHCPTSLQHLAHHVRKSPTARLTEMAPQPRNWWLRPAGHPVSCEWRLTLGWAGRPAAAFPAGPHA
jgi:Lantibiotic dehydratase, N terminus